MEQHNAAQPTRFHAHITHRKGEGHRGCHIEKVEKNGGIAACKNQFLGFFSPFCLPGLPAKKTLA